MAVKLRDIAEMVGVSVNTVSRALQDKPHISDRTRCRIKSAARALGYRPDLNARSLVLRKTSIIGLAVTESDNPVRMEFCERLREELAGDGYRMLTVALRHDWPEENLSAIEELIARHVDGLGIGSVWNDASRFRLENLLQDCRRNDLPVALFGQSESGLADCVEIDLDRSVELLARHLIGRGYRRIALCGDMDSGCDSGYRAAMREHGLAEEVSVLEVRGHRLEDAHASMTAYLDRGGVLPRALIAANDLAALGFMAALRQRGIRVPQDCAVVGIDNIAFGKFSNPALTSIGFDNGVCARAVWRLLRRRIMKEETGPSVHVPVEQTLMIRESS